jgi:type IV pilus assembly protein PilY1
MKHRNPPMATRTTPRHRRAAMPAATLAFLASVGYALSALAAPPTIPLSQVPLTVAQLANPQIVWAVANSESVDGDLSGAIMTGSGSANVPAALYASSSPVNYTVPAGFTPPLNPGAGGVAPYTVTSGGVRYDNSASRLNVAKAGITAVMTTYMANVDFALYDFSVGVGLYPNTYVYYMSPPGGFVFTNTAIPYVNAQTTYTLNNPCYQYKSLATTNTVYTDCHALDVHYSTVSILWPLNVNINGMLYVEVQPSSDDASVNDVFYGSTSDVCITFGTVSPATPYPPNRTLAQYEGGGITESYPSAAPGCPTATGPTNAGFVPYSAEVMYVHRGFGYGGGASSTAGTKVVSMTSAGATPTSASIATALNTFVPYMAPETDSAGTSEVKALSFQSPIAGLLKSVYSYYVSTPPPSDNGCPPLRYVVLVTDGLPTQDLSGHNWPPLGSLSASTTGYNVVGPFNADGSLDTSGANIPAGATADQALVDTVSQITALYGKGIKTYVVGLGAGASNPTSPAGQALTAMAIAGGTGAMMPAADVPSLLNDLSVVLATVLKEQASVAAGAVNSTGLNTKSVIYQAQFNSSDTLQDWTGNLFAYPVNPTNGTVQTGAAAALWQAQVQLDLQSWDTGRLIATWDPVAGKATPFRWDATAALAPAGISNSTALGTALTSFGPDSSGQDVLQFLRGRNAQEVRFGGTFRNRTHKLGDIVFSNPVFVGAPSSYVQSASYNTYANANQNREPMVYIGANDGMLHGFDANTGNEIFAYVPHSIYGNLIKLANPYYNEQHQYFVNGSPVASDVQFADGSWHTIVIATEGAGGQGVFSLDVTQPSITTEAQLSSMVLWDFSDANMGYSFSDPAVGLMSDSSWMVFFGNGYDSASGNPYLYALNPQTGAIVASVSLCSKVAGVCSATKANGLSSVTLANNSGLLSGPANVLYAGDLQGNLWRVAIPSPNPATWTYTVLLQATDSSGASQPITTAPVVTLNPRFPQLLGDMVFTVTGELLSTADLSTTQVQTVYGVYDPPTTYSTPLIRTNAALEHETFSATSTSANVTTVEIVGQAVNLPTQKGWFLDLTIATGMRGVTDPELISGGGLLFTTYVPPPNICSSAGSAWLLDLNYAGGGFPAPQFTVGDSNTAGFSLGQVYAATPALLNFGGTGKSELALVSTSGANQTGGTSTLPPGSCPGNETSCSMLSVQITGTLKHRKAWWEVR